MLPTPTADDGLGAAQVVATLSRDGSSGQVLPTDIASVQDDLNPVDAENQTGPDSPVDDGPGIERVVATLTRDGSSARSLPTDAASVKDEDQTEAGFPIDEGPGTAVGVATPTRDGSTARSLPTDAAIAAVEDSPSQSDSNDTVANDNAKLRARDSGVTLSSVYLLLG